ncbi:hypothetical protein NON20_05120 [Synechocystis sp. B12]|nr:hypothetical protein NON20_05120 [Synechocystis sp. B12]
MLVRSVLAAWALANACNSLISWRWRSSRPMVNAPPGPLPQQ